MICTLCCFVLLSNEIELVRLIKLSIRTREFLLVQVRLPNYSASYMIGVHSFDQEGLPVRKVDRKWNAHFRLTWRQAPEVQCRTAKNKP